MRSPLPRFLVLIISCAVCGCTSTKQSPGTQVTVASVAANKKTADPRTRNNAASLLYDLLNDDKHLSIILLIKNEPKDLNELVKTISETAGQGAKSLEEIAKADPSLDLHAMALPPGEKATREAIAKTKQQELLHASNKDFEFKILMTQVQALNYGAHLAYVASENETRPEHALKFAAISNDLRHLYDEVIIRVRALR